MEMRRNTFCNSGRDALPRQLDPFLNLIKESRSMYLQVFEGTSKDVFHTSPFLRAGTGVGADGGWVIAEVIAVHVRHIREFV